MNNFFINLLYKVNDSVLIKEKDIGMSDFLIPYKIYAVAFRMNAAMKNT